LFSINNSSPPVERAFDVTQKLLRHYQCGGAKQQSVVLRNWPILLHCDDNTIFDRP